MRKLVYSMFISNDHASFHLWWKENLLKHQEVSAIILKKSLRLCKERHDLALWKRTPLRQKFLSYLKIWILSFYFECNRPMKIKKYPFHILNMYKTPVFFNMVPENHWKLSEIGKIGRMSVKNRTFVSEWDMWLLWFGRWIYINTNDKILR